MSRIVLFSGYAESGKTHCAKMLKAMLEENGERVLIINFADALKFIAKEYFGWDGNKNSQGRALLQNLGTDVVRARKENFWVDFVINFIEVFSPDFDYFIIGDCRFVNESQCLCTNHDTLTVNVIRSDYKNSLGDNENKHISETALDDFTFDYTLISESGLDKLFAQVEIMYKLYRGRFW